MVNKKALWKRKIALTGIIYSYLILFFRYFVRCSMCFFFLNHVVFHSNFFFFHFTILYIFSFCFMQGIHFSRYLSQYCIHFLLLLHFLFGTIDFLLFVFRLEKNFFSPLSFVIYRGEICATHSSIILFIDNEIT